VNSSTKEFTPDVDRNTIFWSLIKIKGLGDSLIDKLLKERSKGQFHDVSDFLKRMKSTGFGKNKTEALIFSGAFDIAHNIKNIKQRRDIYEQFLGYTNDVCAYSEDDLNSSTFWLLKQKELTGFGDINFTLLIQTKDTSLSRFFITAEEVQQKQRKNKTAVVAGIVDFIREKSSKKGKFGSIRLRSNNGYVDCTMWSDFWTENKEEIEDAFNNKKIIAFKGVVNFDEYNSQNAVYSERGSKILIF
jgi:DNA polymerase III alpha subunit